MYTSAGGDFQMKAEGVVAARRRCAPPLCTPASAVEQLTRKGCTHANGTSTFSPFATACAGDIAGESRQPLRKITARWQASGMAIVSLGPMTHTCF